jgi:hypothetical protein
MKTMKTEVIRITPDMAKAWIKKNHNRQRNISPGHVQHLAQQMTAGQWQLNGEPIILDQDSNLLDGQHRLSAIIQSGIPCEMLVVFGIPSESFPTIDAGKTRSASNVLAIHGAKNYTLIASTLYGVWNYRRALAANGGKGGSLNSHLRPSRRDVLEEYEANSESYQHAAHLAMKCKGLVGTGPTSIVAAVAILDGQQSLELVNYFFELTGTGVNISINSPVYRLRERFIKNKGSMSKLSSNHLVLLTAKAWNLFARDIPCGVLRLDSEIAFPIL